MRIALRPAVLAAATLTLGLAHPASGQQAPAVPQAQPQQQQPSNAGPKSLLPDVFDSPAPAPAAPADTGPPVYESGAAPAPAPPPLLPPLLAPPVPLPPEPVDPFATQITGRDITVFGPLTPEIGGYGIATFTGSRGTFLSGLANRVTAPIASRWASITLRRALLSESTTPYGIGPGDWVAARASLLLRMGEIDGAKALVDGVPIDRYSPFLYRIAGQTALAAADIGGLCPIAETARMLSRDPLWPLAVGMCAALQGDDATAASIFDALGNDEQSVDRFDLRLAERIATLVGGAGRASNIDWNEAPPLTLFRFGVATAAGVMVPPDALAALGPARFGWLVRAPNLDPEARRAAIGPATVQGSMSAAELAGAIAIDAATPDAAGAAAAPGNADSRGDRLRIASAGTRLGDRLVALRAIWAEGEDPYAGLLESATAAARLSPTAGSAADSAQIIAALLAAGDTVAAARWWPVADDAAAKVRAQAWALLAAGTGTVEVTPSAFRDWRSTSGADDRRAAMLFAALAGLGVTTGSDWDGLRTDLLPRNTNSWSRAIDAAGRARRTGEVTLLAATGLQGPWADVPPLHLHHIVQALVRSGRTTEARLIAAEALTRG
ncbi:hypothetical protein GCM10011529_25700 [Polymorphobacter glacialis]|uniref:Uncharacterized protein n=2 Tax=Sandarakinorhabdus glacialis TaxID=1614636 RepID=A0A916ZY09_9SPHN|nr:hypothetical protein GCM10011529_25700 [Polymorphobacter glacialis]